MPGDRVTLDLSGVVPLDQYATAIAGLSGLVSALAKEVAADSKIDWVIEELHGGSASATIIGLSDDPASVDRVVEAYAQVGRAMQSGEPIPFSESVKQHAKKICSILNGKVTAVTFEAFDRPYTIQTEDLTPREKRKLTTAFGSVEGVVHSLFGKDGFRFTLYDSLFGRAVSCYFSSDPNERARQEELLRNSWEKRAIVQGLVTRDVLTDRPMEVRQITDVIPVIGGNYRSARGVLADVEGDELPEQSIRRARDVQ